MDTTTKDVFEAIKGVYALSTDLVELAAIWLDKPLQTARKQTIRLSKGDMVRVENNYLVDCVPETNTEKGIYLALPATHVILSCWGTIYSGDLQVVCEEIGTDNTITVKL